MNAGIFMAASPTLNVYMHLQYAPFLFLANFYTHNGVCGLSQTIFVVLSTWRTVLNQTCRTTTRRYIQNFEPIHSLLNLSVRH
jgi:hypothetical protein